jgi:hypothetical protein
MKKYTESEFANKIRDKYPDAYDDLSDDELLKIWLRKYPNDEELINFYNVHYEEEETSDGIWNGIKKLVVFIFIILIIFFGINYISNNADSESSLINAVTINDTNENYDPLSDVPFDEQESSDSENAEKFIGKWEYWTGNEKVIINIINDNETETKYDDYKEEYFLLYLEGGREMGYSYVYDKEKDVLKESKIFDANNMTDLDFGEIAIDDNTGNLLFYGGVYTKVE